jgi:DNA polymerase-3 subunit alpha
LAKSVAGWDLNKADGLRKLTKLKGKNPAMAEKLKNDFIQDGMAHSDLKKVEATDIWENIIEPFAGYGFNKAHAIFYSLNGYQTAYYKYHYRAEFMAAVLKSEVEKTTSSEEKIKLYKEEAKRMDVKIMAPDINRSEKSFSVLDDRTIVMGLAAIKGVGVKAVENIITTRQEHNFVSYPDFLYRTGSHIVKKNVIQALAKAGSFDSLGISRKDAHDMYSAIRTRANKHAEKAAVKGVNAWNLLDDFYCDEIAALSSMGSEWDKKTILQGEGETLGEYISGGYDDLFDGFFTNNGVPFARLKKLADSTSVRIEALVDAVTISKTKTGKNKGNTYGVCSLTDLNKDKITMKIWSNKWYSVKDKFKIGKPIRAICKTNIYKGSLCLVLDKLEAAME